MVTRDIEVIDDQLGAVAGILRVIPSNPGFLYRYDAVQPDGALTEGPVSLDVPILLRDSLPGAWGRSLIRQRLKSAYPPEHAYLEHSADLTRPGSFRFRDGETGRWLGDKAVLPSLKNRRGLVADTADGGERLRNWGAASLGGAQPKLAALDGHGAQWIIKFAMDSAPARKHPREEARVMQAAKMCGLATAKTKLSSIGGADLLMSKRFDRDSDGGRLALKSLSTILSRGSTASIGAGEVPPGDWADLMDACPEVDRPEVFRQAAFSVFVHNTDDGADNHALIRIDGRWRLAPAFDMTANQDHEAEHRLGVYGAYTAEEAAASLADLAALAGVAPEAANRWLLSTARYLAQHRLLPFPELANIALRMVA